MKQVSYTQVWGMEQWLQDQENLVGRAFNQIEPIVWLQEMGYKGHITRNYNDKSDNFHITMRFDIPDSIYTFLVLKWQDEIVKVDFDGPTIKEERSDNAQES